MPSSLTRTLVLCSVPAALALVGCDALLTEPAAAGTAMEVTLDPASLGLSGGGVAQPPWGTRELWLRLSGPESSRDTVVLGRLGESAFHARVWLHPDELAGPLEVRARLRLPQGLALFGGRATVENLGLGTDVTIELTPRPVVATIDPGETHLGISAVDGAFHTDHTIPRSTTMDLRERDGVVVIGSRDAKLRLIDPYSGEERLLVDPDDPELPTDQTSPQFSADGDWVYFRGVTQVGTPAYQPILWRIRADGTDPEVVLASGSQFRSLDRPAPSHDGRRLAFAWDPPGVSADFLGILDTATGARLLTDIYGVGPMRWSPDDRWIAYASLVSYRYQQLHLVRPDGTDDHVVAPDLRIGTSIDWSRDGRHVLATSPNDYAIRIDVDTGDVEILQNLGHVRQVAVAP